MILRSDLAMIRTLALVLLLCGSARAEVIDGVVVSIADGDTVTVLVGGHDQHKVRLAAIDAPERGQPFWRRAKQHLGSVVYLQPVRVEWTKRDRYGRIVGRVWVRSPDSPCRTSECPKTLDVGLYMLTVGLAWHYKRYEGEQTPEERQRYASAEEQARGKHAGLWMDAHAVPPWDWRDLSRR